jgi:hypothetical protein
MTKSSGRVGPALLLGAGLFACSARHDGPKTARAGNSPAVASGPTTNAAEVVETGCVSTGPERCFDAIDDNCNGIIDEGCGLETGPIQFVIAWEPSAVDVDLLVTDPAGELAEVGRPLSSGLVKQRDCPGRGAECKARNLENVYLDGAEAPRGTYRVRIVLESLGNENPPVEVRFGARIGGRGYGYLVRLERVSAGYEVRFTL